QRALSLRRRSLGSRRRHGCRDVCRYRTLLAPGHGAPILTNPRHGTHRPVTQHKPFLAVIADTDGVLTSTATLHRQAWREMFDAFLSAYPGQPAFSERDYLTYLDGKPRYDGVTDFLAARELTLPFGDSSDSPDASTICGLGNRKNAIFQRAIKRDAVQVLSGVTATLQRWRRSGLKIGVVSASRNCRAILEAAGLRELP